jgi:hypothetical protein
MDYVNYQAPKWLQVICILVSLQILGAIVLSAIPLFLLVGFLFAGKEIFKRIK